MLPILILKPKVVVPPSLGCGLVFTVSACQSGYVTRTPFDVMQVKYWPENFQISENIKIGKFPFFLITSNFQKLFVIEFNSISSWFEEKKQLFLTGYTMKKRGGRHFCSLLCKIGLS